MITNCDGDGKMYDLTNKYKEYIIGDKKII